MRGTSRGEKTIKRKEAEKYIKQKRKLRKNWNKQDSAIAVPEKALCGTQRCWVPTMLLLPGPNDETARKREVAWQVPIVHTLGLLETSRHAQKVEFSVCIYIYTYMYIRFIINLMTLLDVPKGNISQTEILRAEIPEELPVRPVRLLIMMIIISTTTNNYQYYY